MGKFDSWIRSARNTLFSYKRSNKLFRLNNRATGYMETSSDEKTRRQIAKVPPVVDMYRQAILTFPKPKNDEGLFQSNISRLKDMLDRLHADDVALDQALGDLQTWKSKHKAPCTYIELYQDKEVIINVFVLKPGYKMPLHDHPFMHGLLKVILGSARIRSFTEITDESEINDYRNQTKQENWLAGSMHILNRSSHSKRRLFARLNNDRICTSNSEACTLTPVLSNFHDIEALHTPVAFLDILAPPYETLLEDVGPRKCRYYNASPVKDDVVELVEIPPPVSFYCDQAPYLGPHLV